MRHSPPPLKSMISLLASPTLTMMLFSSGLTWNGLACASMLMHLPEIASVFNLSQACYSESLYISCKGSLLQTIDAT